MAHGHVQRCRIGRHQTNGRMEFAGGTCDLCSSSASGVDDDREDCGLWMGG